MTSLLLRSYLTIQLFLSISFASLSAEAVSWQQVPGCATDISVDDFGTAWILGCDNALIGGGKKIYRRQNDSWTQVLGGAVAIDVAPQGMAWVVNSAGNIYRFNGFMFEQVPGCAKDISVDGLGTAWIIGCETAAVGGGNKIYKRQNNAWTHVIGGAVSIDVDPTGVPWVVNSAGNIYRHNGLFFEPVYGCAQDISVDDQGTPWMINCSDTNLSFGFYTNEPNGNQSFVWTSGHLMPTFGQALKVAVHPDGQSLWVINSAGNIYQVTL